MPTRVSSGLSLTVAGCGWPTTDEDVVDAPPGHRPHHSARPICVCATKSRASTKSEVRNADAALAILGGRTLDEPPIQMNAILEWPAGKNASGAWSGTPAGAGHRRVALPMARRRAGRNKEPRQLKRSCLTRLPNGGRMCHGIAHQNDSGAWWLADKTPCGGVSGTLSGADHHDGGIAPALYHGDAIGLSPVTPTLLGVTPNPCY